MRRVRVRTSSRAFIAAVRSDRRLILQCCHGLHPALPARAPCSRSGPDNEPLAGPVGRVHSVADRAHHGHGTIVGCDHEPSGPSGPRPCWAGQPSRYGIGRRAELVRPAPVRRPRAAGRGGAAAGAAHLRRAPDPRPPPADVLDQVAGCARARPGGQHRRLDRPPARRPASSWTRSARCWTGPGCSCTGPTTCTPRCPRTRCATCGATAATSIAAHPGPALGRTRRGHGRRRLAGREQPPRPDQGRRPRHRGRRGARLAHRAATATTRSPGPPIPRPTCGSACMHSPEPRVLDQFAADGYDLLLAGPHARRPGPPAAVRGPGHQLRHRPGAGQRPAPAPALRPSPASLTPALAARVRRARHLTVGPVPVRLPAGGHAAHAGAADRLDCRRFRGNRPPGGLRPELAGGVWRSLAARFVRDEEAAGSNPATPTRRS